MQTSVIVSVIGPDRPGLIDRLSSVIVSAGGNWEDSRMLRLAGQFAGMVQVVLAEESLASLDASLSQLEGEGLQARLHRAGLSAGDAVSNRVWDLEVVGQDRQGIVSAISGALARLGVNVVELATDCGDAPWSGGRIFKTHARLHCPDSLDLSVLRGAVEAIAHDLMVELKAVEG
jgi:glycine cleavage system regulatory protein